MLMSANLVKVDISEKVMSRLSSSARASRRDESELVEEAIAEYLDRQDMELAAVEQGMLAAADSGVISHQAMKAWLLSWGTDNELPPPEPDIVRRR